MARSDQLKERLEQMEKEYLPEAPESEELEAKTDEVISYNGPSPEELLEQIPDDSIEEEGSDDEDLPEEETVVHEEVSSEETAPADDGNSPKEDWEYRFKTYKAKTDQTIADLRSAVMEKNQALAQLLQKVSEYEKEKREAATSSSLQEAKKILLDKEVTEIVGEDVAGRLSTAIEKMMEARIEENKILRDQLASYESTRVEVQKKDAHAQFIADVNQAVTRAGADFNKINMDQGFQEYLDGFDPVTGLTRRGAFDRAKETKDVYTMSSLFLGYHNEKMAKTKAKDRDLTPMKPARGVKSSPSSTSKRASLEEKHNRLMEKWTPQTIESFYRDVNRGRIPRREALKAQKEIDYVLRSSIAAGI